MMKAIVEPHMFKGVHVGSNMDYCIYHLQFAIETLIMDEKIWLNICTIKVILLLFELVSGLKVNFHKACG